MLVFFFFFFNQMSSFITWEYLLELGILFISFFNFILVNASLNNNLMIVLKSNSEDKILIK